MDYFKLLGFRVRDAVTGMEGVVTSISFDLFGCIQAVVQPDIDKAKPNEIPQGQWYDCKRLTPLADSPVMAVPDFTQPENGSADKPAFRSQPPR